MKEYSALDKELDKVYTEIATLQFIKTIIDSRLNGEKNWLRFLLSEKRAGMKTP